MTRPTPERIDDIRRMARFGVRVVSAQRRDLLAEIDALREDIKALRARLAELHRGDCWRDVEIPEGESEFRPVRFGLDGTPLHVLSDTACSSCKATGAKTLEEVRSGQA